MAIHRAETLTLLVGDICLFYLSLWIMLLVRYAQIPTTELWGEHVVPFTVLFAVWIVSFYVAGLYDKHTTFLKRRLIRLILNTQVVNIMVGVLFFYFIPYFGITPKTNLFIYLVISFVFVVAWRLYGPVLLGTYTQRKNALIIGYGNEVSEIMEEVNQNSRYNLSFISSIDPNDLDGMDIQKEIIPRIYSENVEVIVIDLQNEKVLPFLPHLYNLIFSNVHFVDMHRLYEEMFDRVPLSLLQYNWFLENISTRPHIAYDALKRLIDLVLALLGGLMSLVVYPFVILAIKIEDKGSIFITQERIGQNNEIIKLTKFRSMSVNDGGKWLEKGDNRVTKAGAFLRKTRIDELPQLWNVVRGDISLIGPRPDIRNLGVQLEKDIPFYTVRNIIKPGLSGWAQISQEKPPQSLEATKMRLSYDLYYIKNRSFILDTRIALKTIKTLLSRAGM